MIRIGFGVYDTIIIITKRKILIIITIMIVIMIIIRNPQNPILIIKAPSSFVSIWGPSWLEWGSFIKGCGFYGGERVTTAFWDIAQASNTLLPLLLQATTSWRFVAATRFGPLRGLVLDSLDFGWLESICFAGSGLPYLYEFLQV